MIKSTHWRMEELKPFNSNRFATYPLLSFALIIPLTACSLLPKEEQVLAPPLVEPAKIEYDTAEVIKGELVKHVKGLATVTPLENEPLSFTQSGGRLKKIHVKKGDVVKENQLIAELDSGSLAFELELAEIELKKAEIRLKQAKGQGADSYTIDLAELDVDSLTIQIEKLKSEIEKTKIFSPLNGIVTFVEEKKSGDTMDAFQPVVQVADTSKLQLVYTATSTDELNETKIGMNVEVLTNGKTIKGKVVQTPSEVPREKLEENPDLYQRSIFMTVDELPKEVEVGDSIDFDIITAKADDVLIIPKGALRSLAGRTYVQILDGDAKREVDIDSGLVSATEVEVVSGLAEGDTVILK